MTDQTITCPGCGREFELSRALTDRIRQSLRDEIESAARRKEKQLDDKIKALAQRESEIDTEVAGRVQQELNQVTAQARRKAQEELGAELAAAREELEEKREQLSAAKKLELELRKKEQDLLEKEEALELELHRKLDSERKKIAEAEKAKAAEQQLLKLREKDDLIKSLQTQVGDLQRRIEVGSQERQGEALEGELLDMLRRRFPLDECEEVKKGARGADIVQRVRNPMGKLCGTILWESKNAKHFSPEWVDKLRKDQQEVGADLAVLMTMALPDGVNGFDYYNHVWVADLSSAMSLCLVLREMLIGIQREKIVTKHQEGMKDVIYQYITGQEFSQRVNMIADAYKQMHKDLSSEKRSMQRIWKKREKQISTVLANMAGMYGEIEGLLGGQAQLPGVDALSLEAIAESEEDENE